MKKVALITGGTRGIGRGVAVELAQRGYDLLLSYAGNHSAAAEAREKCLSVAPGQRVEIVCGSVSDEGARSELVRAAREGFGRLDLLVNNAGIAPNVRADLLEMTEESFEEVLSVNLRGPFFLTQLVARWMIELRNSLSAEYRPKIITISSISAYTASINRGEYCISKAGLSMLTPLFASRLAEHRIGVYELRPGVIETDMTAGVKNKYDSLIQGGLTPIARWGTPADVARAVAAIADDYFPFSTGDVFNVDGGFHLRRL